MTNESPAVIQPYKIVSIKRAEAPSGTEGTGWHHYVISQGNNTISGHRQGTLKAVTLAVEEIVVQLNERQLGKVPRLHVTTCPVSLQDVDEANVNPDGSVSVTVTFSASDGPVLFTVTE